MNIKLKVCGMRVKDNIDELIDIKPDYMGLIFYKKSPRFAGEHLLFEHITSVPQDIKKIGVFVNEEYDTIVELVKKYDLQGVQLHGNETPGECLRVKSLGCLVIKAFSIDEQTDFKVLKDYEEVVDFFLFDTKTPKYGGSGEKFDWQILKEYNNKKPFFLSGGIDMEDIDNIKLIMDLNIHAIDINSRFEVKPGKKNINKIIEFKNRFYGH